MTTCGPRTLRALQRKAAALTTDPDDLTYVVAGRERVHSLPPGAIPVTAADVFRPA